jgi:folate-dependent tRNA-U54 methylase TrmFO/GidA
MNANFGIVEPLGFKVKGGKSARNEALYDKGIAALKDFAEANL